MLKRLRRTLVLTVRRFLMIDGAQRAAAFAYYALFSLPSMLVLLATLGSLFVDGHRAAGAVVGYVENYLPLDAAMKGSIVATVTGMVEARGPAGVIALVVLLWSSLQFFTAIIRAVNRAWKVEPPNWWRMPLRGLALLGVTAGALAVGISVPLAADLIKNWLRPAYAHSWAYVALTSALPLVVEFYGVSMFYQLAPRRPTRLAEVWVASVAVTVTLRVLQGLFTIYLANFGRLNAFYGAFGAIVVLLLWAYIAGWVIILGSCLSAARAEVSSLPEPTQT